MEIDPVRLLWKWQSLVTYNQLLSLRSHLFRKRIYLLIEAMMDVIKDFNAENRGLLSVTIVVKKNDPIYKFFLQIMESTVSLYIG